MPEGMIGYGMALSPKAAVHLMIHYDMVCRFMQMGIKSRILEVK
jgi:hypothetical protein